MNTSFARVFNNFHFRMLWFAQIVSQISLNILSFVLAIQVYQHTQSNTAVSLMLLTFGLPAIIFGVAFGGIVDNFDKKAILFFCNLTRATILIGYFLFSGYLFMLYLLSVLISIATQLFIPAEAPSIPQLVDKNDLLTANSLFTITFYSSTVVGSISAGPLLGVFGGKNIYLLIAILMILAATFIHNLPSLRSHEGGDFKLSFKNLLRPVHQGLVFIHRHSRIRQSLTLLTFSQALIATLIVLAPGFADKILHIDVKQVSVVVMGPAAIGLITGAFFVGNFAKKFLRGWVILAGIISTGITLILISILSLYNFTGVMYVIMFFLLILGFSNSFMNVPTSTILQEETDREFRGRIYGVLTSLTGGFSILPVLFSGVLADNFGIGRTLLSIGTIVLLIGIYYLIKRRRMINL